MATRSMASNDPAPQAITKFALPAKHETPTVPPNAVPIDSLCNAGDIVIHGCGQAIDTRFGQAWPVFFQWADSYAEIGPATFERRYDENGQCWLDGVSANSPVKEGTPVDAGGDGLTGVFQFITSSEILLRDIRPLNDPEGSESPEAPMLTSITQRRANKPGANGQINNYYVFG